MRSSLIALVALSLSLLCQDKPGQDKPNQDQDKNQAKYEAKLAGAWLKKAPWVTDYDVARATADEKGLPILAYFTRSYAP